MTKYYWYIHPTGLSDEPHHHIISEEGILHEYYESWQKGMIRKMGVEKFSKIPQEEKKRMCLEDYKTINWASEITKENIIEYIFEKE